MIETVLSVLIISFVFLVLFGLSHMLSGKILLEHAAMRVARARAVGLNEFMCIKAARAAVLPVSGRRLWPEGDEFDHEMERFRLRIYMEAKDAAIARGVLDYERWDHLDVDPGNGTDSRVTMEFGLFDDSFAYRLNGEAGLEENYPLFLNDQGL